MRKSLSNYTLLALSIVSLIDMTPGRAQADHDYWRGDHGRSNIRWNHGLRSRYRFDRPSLGANCRVYESGSPSEAACREGEEWGARIARSIGRPLGAHNGYLIAFGEGLNDGQIASSGNRRDLEDGRNSVSRRSLQELIQNSASQYQSNGSNEGRVKGRSEALNRFESIINTGRPLNEDYNPIPAGNFRSEPNAAGRLIPPPSDNEILRDEFGRWGRFRIYQDPSDSWDREVYEIVGRSYRFRSYYDWNELLQAIEDAKRSDWFGPSRSDTIWSCFYNSSAKNRSAWSQMRAEDPNSWYHYNPNGRFAARFYNPDGNGIIGNPDLPLIFKNALMSEYRYEVVDSYRDTFYEALDEGAYRGYNIGFYLGQEKTYYAGQAEEFNYQFRSEAEKSFNYGWQGGYIQGFQALVSEYKTRPVVSMSVLSIKSVDSRVDGIIEPGEPVVATFEVTNKGLVGTGLTGTFDGALQSPVNAFSTQSASINGSTRTTFETTVGTVANVTPGNLNFSVALNVIGEGNRKVVDSIGQSVQYQVEFVGLDKSFSNVQGRGQVVPKIQNVTTLNSSEEVTVTVQVGDQAPEVRNLGTIMAGRLETPAIGITVADPLSLIGKTVKVVTTVMLGQKLLGQTAFEIGNTNNFMALVEYMDALTDKNSGVGFPGSYEDQLAKTIEMVTNVVNTEISKFGKRRNFLAEGHNPWEFDLKKINKMIDRGDKDEPASILGFLRKKFTDAGFPAAKAAGYKALATKVAPLSGSIKAKGKKKDFESLVSILSQAKEK